MRPRTLEELAKELTAWKENADRSYEMLEANWKMMALTKAEDDAAAAPKDERDWVYKHLDDKFTALRANSWCDHQKRMREDHSIDNCKDCRLTEIEAEIMDLLKRAEEL
jgi:hypothetical protein